MRNSRNIKIEEMKNVSFLDVDFICEFINKHNVDTCMIHLYFIFLTLLQHCDQ